MIIVLCSLCYAPISEEEGTFDEESGECINCNIDDISSDYSGSVNCNPRCTTTSGDTITGQITNRDPLAITGGSMTQSDGTHVAGTFVADDSSGETNIQVLQGTATISSTNSDPITLSGQNEVTIGSDGSISGTSQTGSIIQTSEQIPINNGPVSWTYEPLHISRSSTTSTGTGSETGDDDEDDDDDNGDSGDGTTSDTSGNLGMDIGDDYDLDDIDLSLSSGMTINDDGTIDITEGTTLEMNGLSLGALDDINAYSTDGITTILGDHYVLDSDGNLIIASGGNPSYSSHGTDGLSTNGVLGIGPGNLDINGETEISSDFPMTLYTTGTTLDSDDLSEIQMSGIDLMQYDIIGDPLRGLGDVVTSSAEVTGDFLYTGALSVYDLLQNDEKRVGRSNGFSEDGTSHDYYNAFQVDSLLSGSANGYFLHQEEGWFVRAGYEGGVGLISSDEGTTYNVKESLTTGYRLTEDWSTEVGLSHSYANRGDEGSRTEYTGYLGLNYELDQSGQEDDGMSLSDINLRGRYQYTSSPGGNEETIGGSVTLRFDEGGDDVINPAADPSNTPEQRSKEDRSAESESSLSVTLGYYGNLNADTGNLISTYPEVNVQYQQGIVNAEGSIRLRDTSLSTDENAVTGRGIQASARTYIDVGTYDLQDSAWTSWTQLEDVNVQPFAGISYDDTGNNENDIGYETGVRATFTLPEWEWLRFIAGSTAPLELGYADSYTSDDDSAFDLYEMDGWFVRFGIAVPLGGNK